MPETQPMPTENWSGAQGDKWAQFQDQLDACFADVTRLILEHADLDAGQNVLDIGCGGGAHSLAAASSVGPSGDVLGVDVSAPLIAMAKQKAATLPHVSFLLSDAQTASLPASTFDVATSRFGVMFFADPPAAFANISRSLTAGGRMTFGAWAPSARNPWWRIPAKIAQTRMGSIPPPPPNSAGPMGLADADYARSVLQAAGLRDVSVTEETAYLTHPGGAEGAASLSVRVGAAARVLDLHNASDADREAVRTEMADAYQSFESNGQLAIPAAINIIQARPG